MRRDWRRGSRGSRQSRRMTLQHLVATVEIENMARISLHGLAHLAHVVVSIIDRSYPGDGLRLMGEEFLRDVERHAEAGHGG